MTDAATESADDARSSAMNDADLANGEGSPDTSHAEDEDAPGLGAITEDWPADPPEPSEPG